MITVNLDVDGVLYPSLELDKYKEVGAFESNSPIFGDATVAFVVKLRELINRKGSELKFLTKTCSISQELHDIHAEEKRRWLKKHLLASDAEIIVIRSSEDKSKYSSGILVDDYGKNCNEWESCSGNIAIQFGESKMKGWLTSCNYDDVLSLIKNIFEVIESKGGLCEECF